MNVFTDGKLWQGHLHFPDAEIELGPVGRRELFQTLNQLGSEGWEVVQQTAHTSEHEGSMAYVYGWEWLLKRRLDA
jgi:hypothetical protein